MGNDRISIMHRVTMETLEDIKSNTQSVTPEEVRNQIMENVRGAVKLENVNREKGEKIRLAETLLPQQVAWVLNTLHPICLIETIDGRNDDTGNILGLYQEDGLDEGIYITSEDVFIKIAREYHPFISIGDLNEMFACLKDCAPRKQKCKAKNLIAVNNGIFDFDTKQLRPFTPDLVFLSKSRVSYKVNVQNPVIHNNDDGTDWDVESWMADLSDDPEVVHLLWQILGAIIRPNVAWDKTAWLYSESGNNGKGMVFTQIDGKSGLVHNHVIISDTDLIASKGCTKDQYYFPKIMEWTNEIAGQYMELDFGDKTEDKTTQTERHKREVGEYVWKDDLKSRITESMQVSETEEDWISNLTKYGVNVEVHDSKKRGKYYTYELMDTSKFPDGKKIPANLKSRSYKLGTRYDAEEIESYFLKKEQELQKQKEAQREVPEEKVVRQEPEVKSQEPVSPAPKPVHRVKQKPAQKPVARPAMQKPKVPAQTTNIVRLMGEDDIDDMTDVVDEPVSRDNNDWMALALERKMRQDAKKNREKTQERLNTVRQDASYMTRLRSSDVVARIRNAQREDDNSPDL